MAVTMGTPLTRVLGPKTAGGMADQLGLHTVGDLLRHYPRRYAKRGEMTRLDDLQVGDRVTILAQGKKVSTRPMRQRRGMITEVTVGSAASPPIATCSSPTPTATSSPGTTTTGHARWCRSTRRARTSPAG